MVEGSAYAVAIATKEVPGPSCVGLVVYENPAASKTNWGGIVTKQAIEVPPG